MSHPVFAGQAITADILNGLRMKMVAQAANITLTNQGIWTDGGDVDDSVATEVQIPVEVGATYWFHSIISYSATVNSDFGWRWEVPTGTSMPRQTISMVEGAASGVNTGAPVIVRSPAATTRIRAGGTDAGGTEPENFHSVHEYGSILVGGTPGHAVLRVGQWEPHGDETILRGIQRTRTYYMRVN